MPGSPPDPEGCADLYKNSGLLAFQRLLEFDPIRMGNITVTSVPRIHSRVTFGYCLEVGTVKIAYLCDTIGLPPDSLKFLQHWRPDCVVLDCCYPPRERLPRNHNDVKIALECADDSSSEERMTYIPEKSEVVYQSKGGKEEKIFDALE